jgi:hypothetical protein
MRAASLAVRDPARSGTGKGAYRGGMSQFSESTFQDNREGSSFLSLLGIAVFLVTAGVGLALFIAGG